MQVLSLGRTSFSADLAFDTQVKGFDTWSVLISFDEMGGVYSSDEFEEAGWEQSPFAS